MCFLDAWRRNFDYREILQVFRTKTVADSEGPIMTQFTLICVLGFHLRLHFLHRGDGELFHSHPRHFVSLGILGEYHEQLSTNEERRVRFGTITFRKATDRHNVTPVTLPCVTLALTTPVVRQWSKGKLDASMEENDER